MQRDLNGPQKKKTKYHFIALLILLVIVYGAGAYSTQAQDNDNDVETLAIVLTIGQLALIGIWIFVSIVISSVFEGSKFIVLLYWMFIYWPLLAILATFIFHGQTDIFDGGQNWIGYALLIVEIVTFLAFLVIYYVYPKFVTSKFFLETYSPTRFWSIRLVEQSILPSGETKFVLKYDGIWGCFSKRYYCRYVGEVNDEGLPHGQGVWSENSYDGEVLTGTWSSGEPIAPYSSRQYGGKGNTFAAVKLAYFMATDDTFEANKLVPSNDEPARCGVASVECSVAGEFMSHLPAASLVGEPQVEGGDGLKIGDCCKQLTTYGSTNDEETPVTSLQIYSNDARGIQIDGHLFQPTLSPFTSRVKEIVINVTNSAKKSGYEEVESATTTTLEETEEGRMNRTTSLSSTSGHSLQLEVRNWTRTHTKGVMIFIPGFNSWLKHSLETFGQMMAMAKMGNILPILFSWPGGQVPTYRQASIISGSEKNRDNFLQMLKGLQAEGVTNIHIVTHSLGVQSLMAAMEDTSDGSPSPVSQCFDPAPMDEDPASSTRGIGQLQCRSITLLNPDYNVNAFREKGFQSLRRVSSLITIVGDKADQALFWSSLLNGIFNRLGYSQPSMCDSKALKESPGFHLQQPIGKYIDQMYMEEGKDVGMNNAVHQHKESVTVKNSTHKTDEESKKIWLDCDVIDTTDLDTNVNDLRHSAYNVNSILLRDVS